VRAEISDAKGQLVAMGQATFRIIEMDFVRA
jgi:acyl-coenzyme A thioesterase PaaI-like protein